jgi:hypothetical protein
MTIQATGGYAAARTMAGKLKDVPVDIEPRYVTAQQLEAPTS